MASKRTSNPRIKIHKSGHATLSGLNYDDLRSILTAAALWTYQEDDKAKEKGEHSDECGCIECSVWRRSMRHFIDMASASMDAAISATHPPRRPLTKAERLRVVREEIRTRKIIDAMLGGVSET